MNYYVLQSDETKVPYTIGQLRSMWNSGALTGDTLYCEEGYEEWIPLRRLADELEIQTVHANQSALLTESTQRRKTSTTGKVLGVVCLSIFGILIFFAAMRDSGDQVDKDNNAENPSPTDSKTLEKLKGEILKFTAVGVFTDVKVMETKHGYMSRKVSRNCPLLRKNQSWLQSIVSFTPSVP